MTVPTPKKIQTSRPQFLLYVADSACDYGATRICSSSTSTLRWTTRSTITASPSTPTSRRAHSVTASPPSTAPTSALRTATTTTTTTSTALAGTGRDSGFGEPAARCAIRRGDSCSLLIRKGLACPRRCSGHGPWGTSLPSKSARTS